MADKIAYIGRPPVEVRFGENTEAAMAAAAIVEPILNLTDEIAAVASNETNINTVAARDAAIATVAARDAAIGTVAARDADIGTVAARDADIATVVANIADIQAAPGAAADAVAAASSLYVPSYGHAFSTGDRTTSMLAAGGSFTTDLTSAGGTIDNLIDGSVTNDNTGGIAFNGQDVTGKVYFQWIAPLGEALLCSQFKIKNSGATSYANGKPQRLRFDGTWEDAGTATAVGGATEVLITVTSADTGGYAGFRLLGTSGTMSGSGRMLEVEFKLADGSKKGLARLPSGGSDGDTLGKTGPNSYGWRARYGNIPIHAGVNRMALFMMDDDRDGGLIRNRLADQHHFDFRTDRGTYGPAPKKSARGWLFKKNMVRSHENITGMRTIAVLMRKARNNSTLYEISTTIGGEPMYLRGSDFRAGTTIRVVAPNGEVMPVFGDTSGSNTAGATFLNRGFWHLAFIETGAALLAGRLGLGGDPDLTSDATHAALAEFAYLSVFDGQLSNAMCKAEADWLCPIMKRERDITIRVEECTRMVDLLLMWGQSNIGGDAVVWQWPRQLLEMVSIPSVLIQSANRKDRPFMTFPAPYSASTTSLMSSPNPVFNNPPNANYAQHDGRKAGPDWQIARLAAMASRPRQLVINKVGADGTILAAPSEGGGGSTSWHPLTAWNTGTLGHALTRLYETWQWLLDQGIGFDMVAFWWGQGETTVGDPGKTVQTANWGDDYTDMNAACVTYTAGMWPQRKLITRLREWETGCVGDPTLTAQLRSIQDGLAAADPTNIKIISADGSETDAWGRTVGYHFEGNGTSKLHYNGALLDRLATDANALIPWSTS
ncbi:MAG: hypothetical protein WA940_09200 [Sphingopyxis sp.]